MRKVVLLSLVAWLGLGVATAFAGVVVTAEISKFKDIFVTEFIDIQKTVNIYVFVDATVDRAAESQTLINQGHDGFFRVDVEDASRQDNLRNAANDNSSVLTINQAAGNMNNQGSAVSIAVNDVQATELPGAIADAQASVGQTKVGSSGAGASYRGSVSGVTSDARIENAIDNNTGVVHVNQSPGDMNSQANAVSMAVSTVGGVAMAEADLGQVNSFLNVNENSAAANGINRSALIQSAVNNNTGVLGVNQSSGTGANQANVVSFATVTR